MLRIIKITLFILTLLGLLTLMGMIIEDDTLDINNIEVNIFRSNEKGFVSEEMVLKTIENIDTIKLLKSSELNTSEIESKILLNPYIEEVDCYITLTGDLKINLLEKTPVLRLYNREGKSIYVQENGNFIPLSNHFTPLVMVASGYIDSDIEDINSNIFDTLYNGSPFRNVFELYKQISKSSFLKSQISQIYVNSKGEYDLVPVIGEHIIKLGDITNADEKLQNLEAYYKKNLTIPEWDNYSIINLAYKDQIVCTKK